ncbi:MAG TPA: hypothetical protein VMM56_16705 [Planctomycetaceae bacterium]|nr:hypothetical protein [Planctomycetaceae bacterium]
MRSALILQAVSPWRQQLLNRLAEENQNVSLFRDEELTVPVDIHPPRIGEWLDHRSLMLAVETDSPEHRSAGLCLATLKDRAVASLAIHTPDSTSLDRLECSTDETGQLFELLTQRIANPSVQVKIPTGLVYQHRTASSSHIFDFEQQPVFILDEDLEWIPHEKSDIAAICPGSFFPLHEGHRTMRDAAEAFLGGRILFELTVRNADKPPLDFLSLETRACQFAPGELVLSAVPRFDQKAELFPDCAFVVGYDTALRILDRRFYPQGELESALNRIAQRNCRFVVASRRAGSRLCTRDNLEIPAKFANLFEDLPGFLADVSSSEIREAYWRGETETGPVPIF